MNLKEAWEAAMNGCTHDFKAVELLGFERFDLMACCRCGVKATAGEVAWMLAGGQMVKSNYEAETYKYNELMKLAAMPACGGMQ